MPSNTRLPRANIAGIHISGPNSPKTSIVIMTGRFLDGNLKMELVFEKIASLGEVFSDERLFQLLKMTKPQSVIVDCPISEPPCVSCQEVACPGVNACPDMAVNLMQAMIRNNHQARRRKRPLNPQTQRLWDIYQWTLDHTHLQQPSYSANMAPLLVRARTLQRRLNSLPQPIQLKETSVPHSLFVLTEVLGLPRACAQSYRAFGVGLDFRGQILEAMFQKGWVKLNEMDKIQKSIENFQAFISAFVAALEVSGLCIPPVLGFANRNDWLFVPNENELAKVRF